ncbi:MAG: LysR substrate-binding domain-containing protein, partial [Myxococcota bacterium]
FVRTGRGLRPTARTAALRDPLQTSLAELGVLLAPSEFDPRTTERHVVLGTSDYGAQTSLPAVIEQLASEAPGLSIEVRNWQLSMLGEMSGSDIDLVLSTVPRQTPAQMRLRRLGSDHLVCVMRRGHPLGRRKSLSLADYLAYAHILITMGGDARGTTDRLLEPLGKRRRVALRCPHFLPSFTIVSRTDYLLTAPRFLAERLRSELSLTLAK